MKDKIQFQQMLVTLIKEIESSKFELKEENIEKFLAPMELTKDQVSLVLDYVKEKQQERQLTKEEEAHLGEYLEELSYLKEEGKTEKVQLLNQLSVGNEEVKNRLVELYLLKVVQIAKELKVPGVFLEDLIQEGNLGLTLGVAKYLNLMAEGGLKLRQVNLKEFEEIIEKEVKSCIHLYIEENTAYKRKDSKVLERVLELDECLTRLEKKLKRKVMIDELAEEMKLEEAQVIEIIKLAGENLETKEEEEQ